MRYFTNHALESHCTGDEIVKRNLAILGSVSVHQHIEDSAVELITSRVESLSQLTGVQHSRFVCVVLFENALQINYILVHIICKFWGKEIIPSNCRRRATKF
jgi:hypothetical protein